MCTKKYECFRGINTITLIIPSELFENTPAHLTLLDTTEIGEIKLVANGNLHSFFCKQ